jgi:hypothetical protein
MNKPSNKQLGLILGIGISGLLLLLVLNSLWISSSRNSFNPKLDKNKYFTDEISQFPESYPEYDESVEDEHIEDEYIDKDHLETLESWTSYYHENLKITITNSDRNSMLYVTKHGLDVYYPVPEYKDARENLVTIRSFEIDELGFFTNEEPSDLNPERMKPIKVDGEVYTFISYVYGDGFNGYSSFANTYILQPNGLVIYITDSESEYDPQYCDPEYANGSECPKEPYSTRTSLEELELARKIVESIKFDR